MTTFFVPGTPAPQGSKRYLGVKGGKGITVESSKRVAPWRADVRAEAQKVFDAPFDGPIAVSLTFVLARPKGHYRTGRHAHLLRDAAPAWPASRPDIDKLARAVLDAVKGIAWHDDAQVARLTVWKTYDEGVGIPGLRANIHELGARRAA